MMELTHQISFGNIISTIALIIAGSMAFASVQKSVHYQEQRIEAVEARTFALEVAQQNTAVAIAEGLAEMRVDLRYLRQMVEQRLPEGDHHQ